MTNYERTGKYTVLSKTETQTHYIETIRSYDGAVIVNRIPKHTRAEQSVIDKRIVRALAKFANPDTDMSAVEYVELIK
ncbi:MAG: hypothetical protein NC177_07700 [Ruminococcus flavefaciens]|nr:hypothetical protein [Ruminococcus flavefaciens]